MDEVLKNPQIHTTLEKPLRKKEGMRVAYIMSRFPKITETFILYEMIEQENRGIAIELYPLLRERQSVAHPEAIAWTKRANFHPFISLKIVQANLYFLMKNPIKYVKTFFKLMIGTAGSRKFFVGSLGIFPKSVRFAREMQQKGVTHVHAHFCNHPATAAFIINRLTDIPYSYTAHGSDLHVDRTMLDVKTKYAAFCIAVSEFNKNIIIDECGEWARAKIKVIHCGIDPSVFAPPAITRRDDCFRIICVASHEEVKGHKYLIEACKSLFERGIKFRCDLIGDGPLRAENERLIKELKLEKSIIVHGLKKRLDIVQMMNQADVKVLPSVQTANGKKEGIPVVLMESMAMGIPVISSQLSGIPELIENNVDGLLTRPGIVLELVEALLNLKNNKSESTKFSENGRRKVLESFNLQKNAAVLADYIEQKAA